MRGGEPQIDWLVLTAANRAQARGYRAQLSARAADGRLSQCRRWLVVPDPGDRRVGSGGSTFVVLYELARRLSREQPGARSIAALFEGKRILIIHSGGDSRRLPAYAADGKVFAPVPRLGINGRPTTMFDLVLDDLSPLVTEGRVVIGAGDVLLGIGRQAPDLSGRGMLGVAFPGSLETGSRHGVYIEGRDGRVASFLQKPDEAAARRLGAVRHGKLLVDTGVVSLDPESVEKWLQACGVQMSRGRLSRGRGLLANVILGRIKALDFYQHVLMAAGNPKEFARMIGGSSLDRSALAAVGRTARRIPFRVRITPPCDFLHIGSTAEMLALVTEDERLAGSAGDLAIFNSVVNSPVRARGKAIIERSNVVHPLKLDGGNALVGFPGGTPLHLHRGWGLVCLPIGKAAWSCVLFGERDDFKTAADAGGTLGGVRFHDLLSRWRVEPSKVFAPDGDGSLWHARLWLVGRIDRVLDQTLWMMNGKPPRAWDLNPRKSLAELLPMVNHTRLVAQREQLSKTVSLNTIMPRLLRGKAPPVAELVDTVGSPADAAPVQEFLGRGLRVAKSHFDRARLYRAAAAVSEKFPSAQPIVGGVDWRDLDRAAFGCVADGVIRKTLFLPRHPPKAAVSVGRRVVVESPVRIDLAGGWSDTPPICHEMGGAVVNMAVTLDGARPIRVSAAVTADRVIRIDSADLKRSTVIADVAGASEFSDPHDWAALPKAALALAGITPISRAASLDAWLRRFGGGLHLTMSAAVPKGSGLGTSSILSAAILACLDRVCGIRSSANSLMERTSVLEQMMSTAGGWQDQAGGIAPGMKLVTTLPGAHQIPRIRQINVPRAAMAELRARSLLLYTGRRRLARDILHGVVRRYLNQDPTMMRIIEDLKKTALRMRADLERGDIDAFGLGVLRYWELKKSIDPGSTNKTIERMLAPLTPHLTGYELAGAGGGGFIYMVAGSTREAAMLRRRLALHPPSRGASLHKFDVDARGIIVNVE